MDNNLVVNDVDWGKIGPLLREMQEILKPAPKEIREEMLCTIASVFAHIQSREINDAATLWKTSSINLRIVNERSAIDRKRMDEILFILETELLTYLNHTYVYEIFAYRANITRGVQKSLPDSFEGLLKAYEKLFPYLISVRKQANGIILGRDIFFMTFCYLSLVRDKYTIKEWCYARERLKKLDDDIREEAGIDLYYRPNFGMKANNK